MLVAERSGRASHQAAPVQQVHPLEPDPAGQLLADVGTRHRVGMTVDRDQAARGHGPHQLHAVGQTATREGSQTPFLPCPGLLTGRVPAVQYPVQELHVLLLGVEVAAAAEPQGCVQLNQQVPVRRLHGAVLVRASDVDRAGAQPVVVQKTTERRVERSLFTGTNPVRHAAAVVHLQPGRHATGTVQRLTKRRLQAQEVLRAADCRPLPLREREDRVTQQVRERKAADRDAQFLGARPVDLQPPARMVDLLKEHLLQNRPGPPAPQAPLQRAQLAVAEPSRIPPLQPLQRQRGRQIRHHAQHLLKLCRNVGKGIGPRPPRMRNT